MLTKLDHFVIVISLVASLHCSIAVAKLYKWVDEDGRVHYSDQMPPDQSERRHEVKNEQGITVQHVREAKSPEEIERDRELAAADERRAEEGRRRAQRDEALLDTFPTERDLLLTRDNRLEALDAIIFLTERQLANVEVRIQKQLALNNERQQLGVEVSEGAEEALKSLERQKLRLVSQLEVKQEERAELYTQFETDLDRYRELRSLREGVSTE